MNFHQINLCFLYMNKIFSFYFFSSIILHLKLSNSVIQSIIGDNLLNLYEICE